MGSEMPIKLERRLPGDRTAPGAARRLVREWLVDRERADDAALAVSELVTNAVQHADLGEHGRITIRLRLAGSALRVEVSQPTRKSIEAPAGFPASDRDRGRGLALVEAVVDRWGIDYGGDDEPETLVWFEIDRPRRG
jgi:anti-sigma regulatory factor (Ser/Thr protein kinase)